MSRSEQSGGHHPPQTAHKSSVGRSIVRSGDFRVLLPTTPHNTMQTRAEKRKADALLKDHDGSSKPAVSVGGPSGDRPPPEQGELYNDRAFRGWKMPQSCENFSVQEIYGGGFIFDWHTPPPLQPIGNQKYQRGQRGGQKLNLFDKHLGFPSYDAMKLCFHHEGAAIQYLIDCGILQAPGEICDTCGKGLKPKMVDPDLKSNPEPHRDCFNFRCSCQTTSRSIFHGTVLQDVKIKKHKWLHLLYLWALDTDITRCKTITGVGVATGKYTVY